MAWVKPRRRFRVTRQGTPPKMFTASKDADAYAATVGGRVEPVLRGYQVMYRDDDGRERGGGVFDLKRDAQAAADAIDTDRRRGEWVDPALGETPFGEWAERWLETKVNVTPASRLRLEGIVRTNFAPLRDTPLGSFQRSDVQRFVSTFSAKHRPATVRKVYQTLSAIFTDAEAERLIARTPCKRTNLPRVDEQPRRFLTAEQVDALADAIDPRYRALILLAGYGGLRFGELCGLRVERLDLLRRKITVADAIVESGGELHPGPTKTGNVRTFALPRVVSDALSQHLAAYPPGTGGLVFTGADGKPIRRTNFVRREFTDAITASRIGHVRFHDLRHSSVSIAATVPGAQLHEVGARHGQTSSATWKRYAHLFPARDEAIADGIDAIAERARETARKRPVARAKTGQKRATVVRLRTATRRK